tara:strand:- start:1131 stop:1541 length:411 start_codon:yes stop_codon:yes gene_type:complete
MGNRAVITTAPYKASNVGIYVHWNGGRASVEGFLQAAKALEYRSPAHDRSYALAGLAGLIWSYLGTDGLSVGIDRCDHLDTLGDNGVYLIGDDWQIVDRQNFAYEEEVDPAKTAEITATILAKVKAAADVTQGVAA